MIRPPVEHLPEQILASDTREYDDAFLDERRDGLQPAPLIRRRPHRNDRQHRPLHLLDRGFLICHVLDEEKIRAAELAGNAPDLLQELVERDVLVVGLRPDEYPWRVILIKDFARDDRRVVRAFFLADRKVDAVALHRGNALRPLVVVVDVLGLYDRLFVRDDLEEHFPRPTATRDPVIQPHRSILCSSWMW